MKKFKRMTVVLLAALMTSICGICLLAKKRTN